MPHQKTTLCSWFQNTIQYNFVQAFNVITIVEYAKVSKQFAEKTWRLNELQWAIESIPIKESAQTNQKRPHTEQPVANRQAEQVGLDALVS